MKDSNFISSVTDIEKSLGVIFGCRENFLGSTQVEHYKYQEASLL